MENRVIVFKRALQWVKKNTINGGGIVVSSKQRVTYPEVTGYYIPTLLEWGEKELAKQYASHLCDIQKSNGAWHDSSDAAPYIFDTAQVVRGLLSIRNEMPEVKASILKACDWIVSNVTEEGRLVSPNTEAWGEDESFCSELVHLYCLSPLRDAGVFYCKDYYVSVSERVLDYYVCNHIDRIRSFNLLSHFYAYVIEGLIDMGKEALALECLKKLEEYQNENGEIKGLNNVDWICSTGMFQLALCWYKLGQKEKGDKIFDIACTYQNDTGGWYGCYYHGRPMKKENGLYFADEEISWANKYFLDALQYKLELEFENMASIFLDEINEEDGRYKIIKEHIRAGMDVLARPLFICDLGCGKGRYLKNIEADFGNELIRLYGMDISNNVMSNIGKEIATRRGRLTNIPFEDELFDIVFMCESLEHAVNIRGALEEAGRVTKSGGTIIIIDKPLEKGGVLDVCEWEEWIDDKEITEFVQCHGYELTIENNVDYDGTEDGLFRAWIIKKGNR